MIFQCLQLTEVLENPQNPLRIFHTSARCKHRNIPDLLTAGMQEESGKHGQKMLTDYSQPTCINYLSKLEHLCEKNETTFNVKGGYMTCLQISEEYFYSEIFEDRAGVTLLLQGTSAVAGRSELQKLPPLPFEVLIEFPFNFFLFLLFVVAFK